MSGGFGTATPLIEATGAIDPAPLKPRQARHCHQEPEVGAAAFREQETRQQDQAEWSQSCGVNTMARADIYEGVRAAETVRRPG